MSQPLLSICIPTYNRASYLDKSLKTIINQEEFNRIEVVISDNCSTDNTQDVGLKYQKQYSNIFYYRNDENVVDKNYPLVLKRASGKLRKLSNDTVLYQQGAIKYMLHAVKDNLDDRPQIYFSNKDIKKDKIIETHSMDEYVSALGFGLTWIASVTLWEDDCDQLNIMVDNADTRLGQVPFLLNNFVKRKKAVVYTKFIMKSQMVGKKNLQYGLYHVFYENFLGFLDEYRERELITKECYEKIREELLLDFFSTWVVNFENYPYKYEMSNENLKELIKKEYYNEKYYRKYEKRVLIRSLKERLKKALGR